MANKNVEKLQIRKEKLVREISKSTELIKKHEQNLTDYQKELQKIESQLVLELLIEHKLSVDDLVGLLDVSDEASVSTGNSQREEYDIYKESISF